MELFCDVAIEGLIQGTYDTLLPVWLAAARSVGGFDMDKKVLGWVVSFVCPMQMATCRIVELLLMASASLPCRVGSDQYANLLLGAERRAGVRSGAASAGIDAELAGNHAGNRGAVRNDLDVPHHSIDSL